VTLPRGSNKISGGKVFSSQTRRSSNRASARLLLAAVSRMHRDRLEVFIAAWPDVFGKAEAVTVTARKIAVLFYKYTSSRPACARAPSRVARAASKGAYGALRLQIDLAEVDAQPIVRYSEVA
jgi:hypothetical protein